METKHILLTSLIILGLIVGFAFFVGTRSKQSQQQAEVPTLPQDEEISMQDNTQAQMPTELTEVLKPDTDYQAKFETSLGIITLDLFEKESPITVSNFVKLAKSGFYDGQRFHRVIPDFMIQGGDPLSKDLEQKGVWGTGGPGYEIPDEYIDGLSNVRGTIAMANRGPNTGGSQFFINVVDNTYLDWDKPPFESKHPVFGKVIDGMDIADKISLAQNGEVTINRVTILEL